MPGALSHLSSDPAAAAGTLVYENCTPSGSAAAPLRGVAGAGGSAVARATATAPQPAALQQKSARQVEKERKRGEGERARGREGERLTGKMALGGRNVVVPAVLKGPLL